MYRHCLVLFLSFYTELNVAAAPSDWHCEKNEAGEWSCVTDVKSKAAAAKTQPKPPAKVTPPTKKTPPALVKAASAPAVTETILDSTETVVPVVVNEEPAAITDNPQPIIEKASPVPDLKNVQDNVKNQKVASEKAKTSSSKKAKTWQCSDAKGKRTGDCQTATGSKAVKITKSTSAKTIDEAQQPIPLSIVGDKSTQTPMPPMMETTGKSTVDGWSCAPNTENATWNCQLSGANPKGKAHVVAENKSSFRLLDPAFNLQQERVFKNLQSEFPFDPWQQCSAPNLPKRKIESHKDLRKTTPLEIDSDYSEVFDKEITSFVGNVDMRRVDQHLTAEMANYDTVADVMDTQGNVYYSEDGIALFSNSATLKLATDKSVLRNVLFESLAGPYRGSAEVAYRDSDVLSRYRNAAYTSCSPGNQDWIIHTDRLKMNRDTGVGAATNAWVEFKGVPLFYTPYISFPLDERRKTGFLPPSWSHTAKSGMQLTAPYYWNLAPNYDVLFKPRYLTRRGPFLDANFRYLTGMTKGSVGLEFMPYDQIRKTSRFSGTIKNTTVFTPNLFTDTDINYVSDKDYFYEMGNALSFTNTRYIQSKADINYNREGVSFLTRFEGFQTLDSTLPAASRPYQKLPMVLLNLNHSFKSIVPVDATMNNEFVYFYRSNRTNGQRFNTKPSITLPLTGTGTFLTPKFSLQYTQYLLENQPVGLPKSANRVLPIASIDTGAIFESDVNFADTALLHTIEPRAYYLYIPRANQTNIPIFDTALYDFTFNSLFRENRFSGTDRVQDANQLSLAVSSKLIDAKTGLEYLRFGLGQQYYFRDRAVFLPGYAPETNKMSTLISELNGHVNEHLSFSTGLQWDPYSKNITRGLASVQFANASRKIINVGYRYRHDSAALDPLAQNRISQTDVSFYWPIYDDWYAMGRWLYSLKYNSTQESFVGLEKDSCCWRFSIVGRKYTNNISNTVNAQLQTGIFVQFELKGLSVIGDQIDQFLERNISGYQHPHRNN